MRLVGVVSPGALACFTVHVEYYFATVPPELLLLTTQSRAFTSSSIAGRRHSSKLTNPVPRLNSPPRTTNTIPQSQIEEPFRRLEKYLQAPYPRELVPIRNDMLREEVFRPSRPNGQPVSPELPQAYYHTALEKKGDDLTRLIADEVAIYWCLQFSEDYTQAAKFLNRHAYHPVSALIRNTHWTVLCERRIPRAGGSHISSNKYLSVQLANLQCMPPHSTRAIVVQQHLGSLIILKPIYMHSIWIKDSRQFTSSCVPYS